MYPKRVPRSFSAYAEAHPCQSCIVQRCLEGLERDKPEGYLEEQNRLREFCACDDVREYEARQSNPFMVSNEDSILTHDVESEYDICMDFLKALGFDAAYLAKILKQDQMTEKLAKRLHHNRKNHTPDKAVRD